MRCPIRSFRRLSNVGLAIASVVMLVLSQSPNDLGPLATVALVPWLVTVSRSGAVSDAVMSVGIGLAYAVLGMPWLSAAFHSQGVDGFHGVLGVLMTALWAKGLLFGVVGLLAQRLRGRNNIVRVIVPAVVFGLAEYGAGHSALGLPLLFVGHSQHSVPGVAQLAVVVGVHGITMLLFSVNAALASALIDGPPGIRVAFAVSGAWWTVAIGGLPIAHAFEPAVRSRPRALLLVQPNIVPGRRWDAAFQGVILDEIAAETSRALMEVERSPDAILWPENLLTFPATRDNRLGRRLRDYVNRWEIPVVLGLVRGIVGGDADRYRNSAVWWSPQAGQRDAIDKVRAIPIVESSRMFWGREILARMIGQTGAGQRVEEAQIARPLRGEFTLSPALCFEVLFPQILAGWAMWNLAPFIGRRLDLEPN